MASNSGVATLRNFCWPQARKNACWGAPQTRWTSGQIVPKFRRYAPVVCGLSLSLLGLIFPPVCHAEQMIYVRFDRHSLPHIRLGLAVFRIEGFFFPANSWRAFFISAIFGNFAPSKSSFIVTRAAR